MAAAFVLLLLCRVPSVLSAQHSPDSKSPVAKADSDQAAAGSMIQIGIQSASFRMGDLVGDGNADEKPVHDVLVEPFRLGRFEVTRGQFSRFVAATGYATEAERGVGINGCAVLDANSGEWSYRARYSWRDPGFEQADQEPVVCVSWNDTQAYIKWLNDQTHGRFRLPSEAEWEFAARAGSEGRFPWGMDADKGCQYANGADQTPWPNGGRKWSSAMHCDDHFFFTAPVGSYQANHFGLNDMIGNVWEWVQDCYHGNYAGAPADGSAWESAGCSSRVFRGGAWDDDPAHLRVSARGWIDPSGRYVNQGFRLAEDD
jgi:formylglycine-generating enzyme required for sulfatase activity